MRIKTDVCVIGAGSGGLSVAVGAAQLGARTVLIERHKMGGDCLNTGCVPSKALLAAAKIAHTPNISKDFGIKIAPTIIDQQLIQDHVKSIIQQIAPHDSVERMESLGIKVFRESAYFINPHQLQVGSDIIEAKRFVIATGSSPKLPHIPGLDSVPYHTNETIFDLTEKIDHLIVIGGGPIGMEMAQAHHRLGCKVIVLQSRRILPRDDQELVDVVRQKFTQEGIVVHEHMHITQIKKQKDGFTVTCKNETGSFDISGSHLFIATGRQPNVSDLQLDRAGVVYTERGVDVDACLRTSHKKIYAVGDVIGHHAFTHAASYHASIVIQNMLFRWPRKMDGRKIPWVTYTDPELAQIGMTEAEAIQHKLPHQILRFPLTKNDRAQCERKTDGLIKVVLAKNGKILGASICGDHAGDLIAFWILAIDKDLRMKDIAGTVLPYPTMSEIHKGISSAYFSPILFSKKVRMLVRLLLKLG